MLLDLVWPPADSHDTRATLVPQGSKEASNIEKHWGELQNAGNFPFVLHWSALLSGPLTPVQQTLYKIPYLT